VQRVAAVFANNGAGVRGDLKAVAKAILLDTEARSASLAQADAYGKLREPVLRLTALLRSYPSRSLSGKWWMPYSDDPSRTIGQTPLGAPSVFNFFRPGYVPPGGEAAARGLTLPELQTTTETSVAGYANAMLATLVRGIGAKLNGTGDNDVQTDYSADAALAGDPAALAAKVCARLVTGPAPSALQGEITAAVASIPLPTLAKDGSNKNQVQTALGQRVRAALLLALVSPEFIVQK